MQLVGPGEKKTAMSAYTRLGRLGGERRDGRALSASAWRVRRKGARSKRKGVSTQCCRQLRGRRTSPTHGAHAKSGGEKKKKTSAARPISKSPIRSARQGAERNGRLSHSRPRKKRKWKKEGNTSPSPVIRLERKKRPIICHYLIHQREEKTHSIPRLFLIEGREKKRDDSTAVDRGLGRKKKKEESRAGRASMRKQLKSNRPLSTISTKKKKENQRRRTRPRSAA